MDNTLPRVYYNSSLSLYSNSTDIEIEAQDAVLREQEIETQRVIHGQRDAGGEGGAPSKDNTDIFAERRDPFALKEHLLKMTTEHRLEIALKRGKPAGAEEGHAEIGNGYGVPGGGAYYDSSKPGLNSELEQKSATKELPEFLKQKLRARGVLKDDTVKGYPLGTDNKSETGSTQPVEIRKLPPGWVEAKDPASGASYYYNESTGKTQWKGPDDTPSTTQTP